MILVAHHASGVFSPLGLGLPCLIVGSDAIWPVGRSRRSRSYPLIS